MYPHQRYRGPLTEESDHTLAAVELNGFKGMAQDQILATKEAVSVL